MDESVARLDQSHIRELVDPLRDGEPAVAAAEHRHDRAGSRTGCLVICDLPLSSCARIHACVHKFLWRSSTRAMSAPAQTSAMASGFEAGAEALFGLLYIQSRVVRAIDGAFDRAHGTGLSGFELLARLARLHPGGASVRYLVRSGRRQPQPRFPSRRRPRHPRLARARRLPPRRPPDRHRPHDPRRDWSRRSPTRCRRTSSTHSPRANSTRLSRSAAHSALPTAELPTLGGAFPSRLRRRSSCARSSRPPSVHCPHQEDERAANEATPGRRELAVLHTLWFYAW